MKHDKIENIDISAYEKDIIINTNNELYVINGKKQAINIVSTGNTSTALTDISSDNINIKSYTDSYNNGGISHEQVKKLVIVFAKFYIDSPYNPKTLFIKNNITNVNNPGLQELAVNMWKDIVSEYST